MDDSQLKILKGLSPFSALSDANFIKIAARGEIKSQPAGALLFKRFSNDADSHWLLTGQLNLVNDAFENRAFTESDSQTYGAVDDFQPHTVSAVCETPCAVFTLSKTVQSEIETLLEAAASTAENSLSIGNWMERLLSTPLFEFIPPTNIQELFKRFKTRQVTSGEIIIKQGEPGDYFYMIKTGSVSVHVEMNGKVNQVAKLTAGQSFGQDALVSDLPRNATIMATAPCELGMLTEADFEDLLLSPVIEVITPAEIEEAVRVQGTQVQILNLYQPDDLQPEAAAEELAIPFMALRNHIHEFSKEIVYVVRGPASPKINLLGAYLLNEAGHTAYVLAADPV
ncbi:MAG: cyclic nucleotide-binding domain-containing protein [Pseudomonadales bacterium]|nr:cyclic nucleotide-binding domain-containing protein [Pseudomonadales bacterium]